MFKTVAAIIITSTTRLYCVGLSLYGGRGCYNQEWRFMSDA
jgi:hypothetical protein